MTLTLLMALTMLSAGPPRFDLICAGTLTTTLGDDVTTKPITQRFRIDLERMIWCDGNCSLPKAVIALNASEIVLARDVIEQATMSSLINRFNGHESGQLVLTVDDKTLHVESDSQCERADFSGIPQSLF